jgi:hypothetical protein
MGKLTLARSRKEMHTTGPTAFSDAAKLATDAIGLKKSR